MRKRISKRAVDALEPGTKTVFLWDSELVGFGVRVTPAGAKSFVFQWQVGRRSRRLTIGKVGAPWTPDSARKEALRLKAEVATGSDPADERATKRQAATVAELIDRFLGEHVGPKLKPRTADEYRRLLEKHVKPKLGTKPVAEVTRADIARLHHGLRARPYIANRVLAVLGKAFTLAERWGLRPEGSSNPARGVDRYRERARERFLSTAELARLGDVLRRADTAAGALELKVSPFGVAALRLLLLTGCRRDEVLGLRWRDVDFERGLLLFPDSKTGAKTVPLSAPAAELLADLPRLEGSPWVLPGRDPAKRFVGLRNQWLRVREAAGLEDVRLHDLRHSFASVAAGGGESLPLIGALLGHTQAQTTKRYAHLADDPRRGAAERTAGTIASVLDGRPKAEVVELRGR